MADIQLDNQGKPATPSAGSSVLYTDSTNKEAVQQDDTGIVKSLRVLTNAGATTTAGADIYIVGSNITFPPYAGLVGAAGLRVGAMFQWLLNVSKTGAGTATPVLRIRTGTGVVGDTSRLAFTFSVQTANVASGMMAAWCTVTTAGTSGIINGGASLLNAGGPAGTFTQGLGVVSTQVFGPTASGTFDLTTANLVVGLSIDPGAAAVWTIQTMAQGFNL